MTVIAFERRSIAGAWSEAELKVIAGAIGGLRDGDWDAMPGLTLIDTHGHTPGHQSAFITLMSGERFILPFDVGDLAENFTHEIAPGSCSDEAAALAAIRRIKALQVQHDATMLLFHDPVAIQSLRLAPAYYG